MQGVSVQAGAQLEATDLTITAVQKTGVEVKGEGSSLKLTQLLWQMVYAWLSYMCTLTAALHLFESPSHVPRSSVGCSSAAVHQPS